MRTVNMHEAKTHLSRLVDAAAKGEPFVIARAGKPLVKVVPLEEPGPKPPRRLGSLAGLYEIPKDFDRWAEDEIADMFEGTADEVSGRHAPDTVEPNSSRTPHGGNQKTSE